MLQRKKGERKVSFSKVIRELYSLTDRIEPSFSSKLVATIRPELPVYDSEVRRHMKVMKPPTSMSAEDRISWWIAQYDRMINVASCVVKRTEFGKLRERFDDELAPYKAFTKIKKLDLMLWQCRPNERGAADA